MRHHMLLLVGTLLLAMPVVAAADGTIAVIINKQSPIDDLSTRELKAAFEGYGLPGSATQNIELVYLTGGIEDSFNQKVLGVSSKRVKVYWLRRVFKGESDLRRILKTAEEGKAFSDANEAAIGFIPASELDDSVKAISIDARRHDDAEYTLR